MPSKKKVLDDKGSTVDFHYLKGNNFRIIHADGIYGGATPDGNLMMTVWNQRLPIPSIVTHAVGPGGVVGEEVARESRSGIVREVEVGIVLKPDAVQSIVDWLLRHSDQLTAKKVPDESKHSS